MRTFEEHFTTAIRAAAPQARSLPRGECQSPDSRVCTICHASRLDYPAEVALKNTALRKFWGNLNTSVPLQSLVPSPLGRGYRTLTKRKAFHSGRRTRLGLIDQLDRGGTKPFQAVRCAIEPGGHAAIYAKIQEDLDKPHAAALAESLTYVIIKGSYTEFTVIFNVRTISPGLVKSTNTLSKSLTRSCKGVVGVFLYKDESAGRYYMGSSGPNARQVIRKVFGKEEVYQKIAGRGFLYSPVAFAQVNQSILEEFVGTVGELLGPVPGTTLYDLYSGFGMFALCLSDKFSRLIGVEISRVAVESAIANARRQEASNVKFLRSEINAESAGRILKNAKPEDAVLLDPPRGGTSAGVIESIAARRPSRVAHLFCNIDLMADELARWKKAGYSVAKAIPFDMFPGTPVIETVILLHQRRIDQRIA